MCSYISTSLCVEHHNFLFILLWDLGYFALGYLAVIMGLYGMPGLERRLAT